MVAATVGCAAGVWRLAGAVSIEEVLLGGSSFIISSSGDVVSRLDGVLKTVTLDPMVLNSRYTWVMDGSDEERDVLLKAFDKLVANAERAEAEEEVV